jgi:hypothetical protein
MEPLGIKVYAKEEAKAVCIKYRHITVIVYGNTTFLCAPFSFSGKKANLLRTSHYIMHIM